MWIVINLNEVKDIESIINYVESIYYEYKSEVILSVISNTSIKETFLILYKIISSLSNYNVKVRRGPILYENIIIGSSVSVRLSDYNYKKIRSVLVFA